MAVRASSAITDRDREVLAMLAEHRVLAVPQIGRLLDVTDATATKRLLRLRQLGLLRYEHVFQGQPAATWISARGLGAIGSRLPPPRLDLKGYRHDIGVGWLWLAARDGAFGRLSAVTSEREMRSHDMRGDRVGTPYGVGVGGIDSWGRPARHYPDLLLTTVAGQRVAVELELTRKSPNRLNAIMRGYAGDAGIEALLYVVPDARLAEFVGQAAARAGIADLVHVQRLSRAGIHGGSTHGQRSFGTGRSRAREYAVTDR